MIQNKFKNEVSSFQPKKKKKGGQKDDRRQVCFGETRSDPPVTNSVLANQVEAMDTTVEPLHLPRDLLDYWTFWRWNLFLRPFFLTLNHEQQKN